MSVQELFFRQKNTRTKGRYWNRMSGRNNSYVLLFLCLKIIKICLSRTIFLDKRTQGHKGDMGIEGLVETILMSKGNRNLFCFCIVRRGSVKVELKFLIVNKNIIFVA